MYPITTLYQYFLVRLIYAFALASATILYLAIQYMNNAEGITFKRCCYLLRGAWHAHERKDSRDAKTTH